MAATKISELPTSGVLTGAELLVVVQSGTTSRVTLASIQAFLSGVPTAAPVFTAAPYINGTPQVGVASSYTSGTATGTPTPTLTGQWLIDGATVGATYTPISSDAGKVQAYRQTATNSAGTATSTSAGVTVAAAAPAPAPSPTDTRPRFFLAPSSAATSGTQAYIDGATAFGSNGGRAGSFALTTTAGNYGWFACLASAGAPTFTSASAPGFPGGWTSQGTFAATQGSMQLWRQDYPNANPSPGDTWTVS